MEKLLTIKDICEMLQVSQSLVYKWIHFKYIPHLKLGTLVRFRESEIVRWLKVKERRGRKSLQLDVELETAN